MQKKQKIKSKKQSQRAYKAFITKVKWWRKNVDDILYLAPISTEQIKFFNVTFEPKCRNNWHIHHAKTGGGQMLIGVGGRGYYQEWGKEPVEIKEGTVIHIPANVKHWHGAAPDSWFSHLAFELEGIETSNEWQEPVSNEDYDKLK